MNGQAKDALETLIDAYSLSEVLHALECICFDKAEHLRSNWQDADTARVWERAGTRIASHANTISI